ncbi:hypothetical protein M3D15_04575 [Pseudoclavibacter alba]|uniref:DUF4333 domain-containing protein n=1 Tax=Pseudoclavibacter albus TaxID=272241 RepID=A0ABT2HWC1_9MICO|nr:hypothetical protein [Pseudoclavibacter alba]MCT2042610.1 hypothetical protein [Pseudoclavibacter alba]
MTQPTPEQLAESSSCMKTGCLGLIVVFVIGVAAVWIGSFVGKDSAPTEADPKETAALTCSNTVTQHLADPDATYTSIHVNETDGHYGVIGSVTSRGHEYAFTCDVTIIDHKAKTVSYDVL